MNDELKKAIERLRNAPVVSKSGCMLGCDKWDIAAVCAAAEKAMRVVEAAKRYRSTAEGEPFTAKAFNEQELARQDLDYALSAMGEP